MTEGEGGFKREQIRAKLRVHNRDEYIDTLESNLSKEKCNILNIQVHSSNDDVEKKPSIQSTGKGYCLNFKK